MTFRDWKKPSIFSFVMNLHLRKILVQRFRLYRAWVATTNKIWSNFFIHVHVLTQPDVLLLLQGLIQGKQDEGGVDLRKEKTD